MEKPMRKILNPNLISKRRQKEIEEIVLRGLRLYPFKDAMRDAMRKAKHQH